MKFISYESPSLHKFCPAEFDITNGCNTLRIGTLWGFREAENQLLRDAGEGEFEYRIRFPKLTRVSREWISEFEVGIDGQAEIESIHFDAGTHASTKDLTLRGSSQNCWIFCVSMSNAAVGNVSEAHESHWTIPGENVQEFGAFLAELLWSRVSLDDLPSELVKKHSFQELCSWIGIVGEMKPVRYVDRELHIEKEEDYPIEKIRAWKADVPFLKPIRFSEEREFRFAFWLTFKKEKISIRDNPKILNLRQIDRFISTI